MLPELTNLLPPDRIRAFVRNYYLRVLTLAIVFAIVVLIIHSVLLMPTHFLLVTEVAKHEQSLAALGGEQTADEALYEKELAELTRSATALIVLGKNPSVVGILKDVLLIPHVGVSISGLSYSSEGDSPTVVIRGTANTRELLLQYRISLQGAPFVASAVLPVTTYAKDTDIPFEVTLTLTKP